MLNGGKLKVSPVALKFAFKYWTFASARKAEIPTHQCGGITTHQ